MYDILAARVYISDLSPRYTIKHCRGTLRQNIQLLWKQTDFDFTIGQCLVSDENSSR